MTFSDETKGSKVGSAFMPLVYVVDDHPVMCESIDALLSSRGYSVECFVDPLKFLSRLERLPPGLVLLDLRMPGMSGLDVLDRMRGQSRQFPVVMITGHGEIEDAVKSIKAGARDFIQKPFEPETLFAILEKEWESLNRSSANCDQPSRIGQLTPRERDVVTLVAAGKPNKIIGHELGISIRTVEMHRARAMQRLGCKTLADLLRALLSQSAPAESDGLQSFSAK